MADRDKDLAVEYFLELDGTVHFVDEKCKYRVEIKAKRTDVSPERPHGLNYSLTLHNEKHERERSKDMKTLNVGIASYQEMKSRAMAIARGDYKPKRGEPKVWFPSLEAFAGVLSEGNRELLQIIVDNQPESMTELAELSGRKPSSLSRTLKSMAHYGLIDLQKDSKGRIRPKVNYKDVALDLPISKSHGAAVA